MFKRLTNWLDARGDLMSVQGRIFMLGPVLTAAAVLTFIWEEVPYRPLFWAALVPIAAICSFYYAALIRALVRQRERFYQHQVRPHLSREYREP